MKRRRRDGPGEVAGKEKVLVARGHQTKLNEIDQMTLLDLAPVVIRRQARRHGQVPIDWRCRIDMRSILVEEVFGDLV